MQRTRFGFYVGYDTTKRKKYSEKQKIEIARLSRLGLSVRQIASELDIPSGSIHYILRQFNLVFPSATKPSNEYLTRAEAKYLYDITDAQFDYARTNHKKYTVKFNNVVFIHQDYIFKYIEDKKGYKDRYGKTDTSQD